MAQTVTLVKNIPGKVGEPGDEAFDDGIPRPEHFSIVESAAPECSSDGDILVRVLVMSADP